jgi:hypothetical protein
MFIPVKIELAFYEPETRLELVTCCLQNSCSTTELPRQADFTGSRKSKLILSKLARFYWDKTAVNSIKAELYFIKQRVREQGDAEIIASRRFSMTLQKNKFTL